jgi:Uncharacterized protein conserved in bacteria (DUF2066)
MGTILLKTYGHALQIALSLAFCMVFAIAAWAAGPVETSVFAVQGVAVDVTDTDAATAKNKALVEVQVKALQAFAAKLGTAEMIADMAAIEAKDALPYLKSLSIEEETVSPGRYTGKFTVRFLPDLIKPLLARYGIILTDNQSPAILVIPVWEDNGRTTLWQDNPWRKAWGALHAEQSEVPVILPLGDREDASLISAAEALNNDPIKLEKIRRRYDVITVLVAYARPEEGGGIHAKMQGITALGKVKFDKTYRDDANTIEGSAEVAVNRFHDVMIAKFRADAEKMAGGNAEKSAGPQAVPVHVVFSSPSQWNGLRSRIISTPGVQGVDVSSLDVDGATVSLLYSGSLEDMQYSFQASGLQMTNEGGGWTIAPL